jgi:hypothetical protein
LGTERERERVKLRKSGDENKKHMETCLPEGNPLRRPTGSNEIQKVNGKNKLSTVIGTQETTHSLVALDSLLT